MYMLVLEIKHKVDFETFARSSLLCKITEIHLKCCRRCFNTSYTCTVVILRLYEVDNLLLPVQKKGTFNHVTS